MNIFAIAARDGYRYNTTIGASVNTEDLYNLSLEVLNSLAVAYDTELSAHPKKSFITEVAKTDKTLENKFEIVQDIIKYKLAVKDTAIKAAETKALNAKIRSIIADKQDGALADKSIKQLEAMLKKSES